MSVTRLWHSKHHISIATVMLATEKLWEAVFSLDPRKGYIWRNKTNKESVKSDPNRELFTKHGLHMNDKGKELAARKIISTIKHTLCKKSEKPISMEWKQNKAKKSQEKHNNLELTEGGPDIQDGTAFQKDIGQEIKKQDGTNNIPARRLRKPPTTRRDDFLWMDGRQEKPSITKEEDLVSCHIFATWGLPEKLVSDHGPPFNSVAFAEFPRKNHVKHKLTPVYHPSSNGQIERGVRTLKQAF
jgi:hypothetical protein